MEPVIQATTSQLPGFIVGAVIALLIWLFIERKKLKADLAKFETTDLPQIKTTIKADAADAKAIGEIGWDEITKTVNGWRAELALAVAARVKADQAAAAAKNQPIAANLANANAAAASAIGAPPA
jgi:hypothetical protein